MENQKTIKRIFTGEVLSTSMEKTITVNVDRMKPIKKYQKAVKVSRKYHVHDEKGLAKVGDTVEFTECRPISKTKKWYLTKVLSK